MVNGTCSSEEAQLVEAHISAQIDAIANEKWESAYSYASPEKSAGLSVFHLIKYC